MRFEENFDFPTDLSSYVCFSTIVGRYALRVFRCDDLRALSVDTSPFGAVGRHVNYLGLSVEVSIVSVVGKRRYGLDVVLRGRIIGICVIRWGCC